MTMAADLMGLGVSPLQAMKTATGGVGPLTIGSLAATGSFASSTKLGCSQYLVSILPSCVQSSSVGLPTVGGDVGAYLADDFIINNQTTSSIFVWTSTSVLMSMNGSLSSVQRVQSHATVTFYPIQTWTTGVSTAVWIGVGGT